MFSSRNILFFFFFGTFFCGRFLSLVVLCFWFYPLFSACFNVFQLLMFRLFCLCLFICCCCFFHFFVFHWFLPFYFLPFFDTYNSLTKPYLFQHFSVFFFKCSTVFFICFALLCKVFFLLHFSSLFLLLYFSMIRRSEYFFLAFTEIKQET